MKWFWLRLDDFFAKRNNVVRKPTQTSNLHWVKANKPIGEMSEQERHDFASRLSNEILIQNSITEEELNKDKN
jgi:hypothetical protein